MWKNVLFFLFNPWILMKFFFSFQVEKNDADYIYQKIDVYIFIFHKLTLVKRLPRITV